MCRVVGLVVVLDEVDAVLPIVDEDEVVIVVVEAVVKLELSWVLCLSPKSCKFNMMRLHGRTAKSNTRGAGEPLLWDLQH